MESPTTAPIKVGQPVSSEPPVPNPTNRLLAVGMPVALAILLLGIGILFYQNQQLKRQIQEIQPTTKTAAEPEALEESINWLTYQNEKYDYLKFKYPEGSVITMGPDPDPEICGMEGCFTLTLVYEDLKLEVLHITGVGGRAGPPTSLYSIISGNPYEGIGKVVTQENSQTKIDYFHFSGGGQQFGFFLVETAGFTFTMPTGSEVRYEKIADIIACSALGKEPKSEEIHPRAYWDRERDLVIGVDQDKSVYTVFSPDSSIDEAIDNFRLNPTSQYLAITTSLKKDPNIYHPGHLYFYDLERKEMLDFEGISRRPSKGIYGGWTNRTQFIYIHITDAGTRNYSKYDLEKRVRTSITQEEYEGLERSVR